MGDPIGQTTIARIGFDTVLEFGFETYSAPKATSWDKGCLSLIYTILIDVRSPTNNQTRII